MMSLAVTGFHIWLPMQSYMDIGRLIRCGIPLFQSDYLRKISLKMLTMETKHQGGLGQPSNQFGSNNEPANPG